jgi:hypothetical protein
MKAASTPSLERDQRRHECEKRVEGDARRDEGEVVVGGALADLRDTRRRACGRSRHPDNGNAAGGRRET